MKCEVCGKKDCKDGRCEAIKDIQAQLNALTTMPAGKDMKEWLLKKPLPKV